MNKKIKKAGVIGAGVMGANISAQLTNVGIDTILLDIVPPVTGNDTDRNDVKFRNSFAIKGVERAKKSSPASFYLAENAELITVGNLEDDISLLKDVDIVIEAIIEDLSLKKELFKKIEKKLRPDTIVTSNTSGISVADMCEGLSQNFREHFAVTHFFNPPRYMKLLEIVKGPDTLPEVIDTITENFEHIIGKRIVFAKDTPNFIANRIAVFTTFNNIRIMTELGLTVEAVDELTGAVVGFPKSATFRTNDIVGLDTLVHVAGNVVKNAPDDEKRNIFIPPDMIKTMMENGFLGDKSGQGFYKKERDGKGNRVILSLDLNKMEYREREPINFDSLHVAVKNHDLTGRIKGLYYAEDNAGSFTFRTRSDEFIYAANRIPEIADDILNIDNALKWGFNREMGPFEMWDAIGLERSVSSMEKAGYEIPLWINKMLKKGFKSFYTYENGIRYYYDPESEAYIEEILDPDIIRLPSLKERQKKIAGNRDASLVDIGDGVACLEFHSKMNTFGEGIIDIINESVDIISRGFEGMVIANHAENFSTGANLHLIIRAAEASEWDKIDYMVKVLQDTLMRLKYMDKPVVAAPAGMTLGGGCEICLAADRVRYAAETYIGFVEAGVGLIPAGGGTKELLIRNTEQLFEVPAGGIYQKQIEMQPFITKAFETIALAKISTSGPEAGTLGYLRKTDRMTVNRDFLLSDAKKTVIAMNMEGYKAPMPLNNIRVPGRDTLAVLKLAIWTMHEQGYATDYDVTVAEKTAHVLCGGELFADTKVSEQYLLDLEREVFLSLCGNKKTRERMQHMIMTGKVLRN
ncbi:MAG: 3-hydroxyacyl-CoA dehydrogenase NAD-binding domain-containing protein [Desulfobacteraceae bacterium]|jgi:3-hydroxyacyl-CoA dehydrogenase